MLSLFGDANPPDFLAEINLPWSNGTLAPRFDAIDPAALGVERKFMDDSEKNEPEKDPAQDEGSNTGHSGSGQDSQKSMTHNASGVQITVSIKDEKKGEKGGEGDKDKPEEDKKDGDQKSDDKAKDKKDGQEKKKPLYKKPGFILAAIIILAALIIGGIFLWLYLRQYVSTDDAYIDGHVTQVSPRASAQVTSLRVRDNQFVHQGDLLVELDPTDYEVALDQAKAQLAGSQGRLLQAEAQTNSAVANVAQAQAQVESAEVTYGNATRDLERYQSVDVRARSQQQLDNAFANQKNALAQLKQAQARLVSAQADVKTSQANVVAAAGDVQTAEANVKRAEVNLSYCRIYAPINGRVTLRTVEVGNYVTIGQAMFVLVDPNVWVTANFKETQLAHMRTNQPVTLKVDAFPGTKFQGHIDSIQAGTGSRFSVLPAENATGNYVKIVQRVPVKIIFEHAGNTNDSMMLSPGLSVRPRVKVQ